MAKALGNEEIQGLYGGLSSRCDLCGGNVNKGRLVRRTREMAEEGAKVVSASGT
jgi:hypothetical protein